MGVATIATDALRYTVSSKRDRRFETIVMAQRRFQGAVASTSAQQRRRRAENVSGPLWVDDTCIDCDACRWMAPHTFTSQNGASAVTTQPLSPSERRDALHALVTCPTFSIHVDDAAQGELAAARDAFPLSIPGIQNVYHLGWHDRATYGAASYLVRRQEGNIMIDVPRWSPQLAKRIKEIGGISHIILSHRDDVGAHAQWASAFGATRVIHASEVNARQGTDTVEWQLDGGGDWTLGGDVVITLVPGHTQGHIAVLYTPSKALFTGDHLAYSARLGRLTIFRAYNWFSVARQLESTEKLMNMDFLHVLPGHGRRWSAGDGEERRRELKRLLREEGYDGETGV